MIQDAYVHGDDRAAFGPPWLSLAAGMSLLGPVFYTIASAFAPASPNPRPTDNEFRVLAAWMTGVTLLPLGCALFGRRRGCLDRAAGILSVLAQVFIWVLSMFLGFD